MKDALDRLDRHRDPLQSPLVSRVTLAGLMVLTAEDIRDEGLPDWMQVCYFNNSFETGCRCVTLIIAFKTGCRCVLNNSFQN